MRPRAKTFEGFEFMISAAAIEYFAKDKLIFILFKDFIV